MKRIVAAIWILAGTAFCAHAGVHKELRFAKGATSITFEDAVVRGERDRYLVGAMKGQYLSVKVQSVEDNAVFDVLYPGANDADETDIKGVALPAAQEVKSSVVQLPSNGKYMIVVGGTRGNAQYKMTVAITNEPPVAQVQQPIKSSSSAPSEKKIAFRVIGADPKGNVHYLAPATVSSNGRQATGFIITNFGSPYSLQGGKGSAGSTLMSVEVMCDRPMIRTVQQMFRQGQNLAGSTLETGVKPTDFVTFPEGAMGQVYQMVLCMDEGKRNQGLERNQAKFPQYQPLSFSPKDIER